MSAAVERGAQRLFFALWPDAGARAALAAVADDLRRSCGGRMPPAENLHLTLAFLGEVSAARLPELQAMAAGLAGDAFVLTLDRIGAWRPQRLVWAAPAACPPELDALAAALAAELRAGGFRTERRRFKPHVTLLRDARGMPAQVQMMPLRWHLRDFVLVLSEPAERGVHYRIVGKWPLRHGADL